MRPARALINLEALRHNYRLARKLAGGRALAVVKADAYGHGAVRCAQALQEEADGFAVACIEEALELRESGIHAPILLLEGFFDANELPLIDQHDLWCVVHSDWQIDAIQQATLTKPLKVWLKLDSGMHRIGFSPASYLQAWQRLQALPQVHNVVAMSHFARADELDSPRTDEQIAIFQQLCSDLGTDTSLANSPALLGWPQARSSWGRAGLMLYGVSPYGVPHEAASRLRPVMTLQSRIIGVRDLQAGEPVGYGGQFVTTGPTRIGVAALGYADGYPQFAPTGTPVAVDGQDSRIAGRVSMDMLTIDLTHLPDSNLGSEVEFWGNQVSANEVAIRGKTSPYRLLCGLKRVSRIYLG